MRTPSPTLTFAPHIRPAAAGTKTNNPLPGIPLYRPAVTTFANGRIVRTSYGPTAYASLNYALAHAKRAAAQGEAAHKRTKRKDLAKRLAAGIFTLFSFLTLSATFGATLLALL